MAEESQKRVYILDGLRFLAAIGVVLYHLAFRMPMIDRLGGPEFPEIVSWTKYLHLGVRLFFMISGFVIAFTAEGKSALQFAWSRVVRLYPAYWLCVGITFTICHYFWRPQFDLTLGQGLFNLTMLQGIFKVPHVDWPYWTLVEELRFYGLIFLLLTFKQFHRLLTFVAVWLAICAIDLFKHVPLAHYEMSLEHAPFFAAGVVYYDAFKRGFLPVHWLLATASFLLGCKRFLDWSAMDGETMGATCSPVVIVSIFAVLHLTFILIALDKLAIRTQQRWLVIAGGITYPLYLIHNRLGVTALIALQPTTGRWLSLGIVCVGACVVSYAIWRWWEQPLSAWLRRLSRSWFAS
jgi:peptidoglycan/LPS O-acetylase OafA/YrhL